MGKKTRKLRSHSIGKNCPQKPISIMKWGVFICQSHPPEQSHRAVRSAEPSCTAFTSTGPALPSKQTSMKWDCFIRSAALGHWANWGLETWGLTLLLGTTCSHHPSAFHSDPWSVTDFFIWWVFHLKEHWSWKDCIAVPQNVSWASVFPRPHGSPDTQPVVLRVSASSHSCQTSTGGTEAKRSASDYHNGGKKSQESLQTKPGNKPRFFEK